MQNPSDEIKSRLDIVDVLREYIQLKPAGLNFRARCPFHQEKTPSFMVSPEKQIWHCFGCGKGGDIFSFVMEMEGVDFVGALKILAHKAGVVLKRQDPKLTSQRNKLLDILELSRKYYHKVLLESQQAEKARKYLADRGLAEDTISEWSIGYSPSGWDNVLNFLKSKGYSENEIFLAGMSVSREKQPGFYDRFRERIMFPIYDVSGNAIAFSARISPENEASEKLGKYINSPQTMIYDKSKVLFGLDKAKMEIKKHDCVIIVEGQMDVITTYQAGFKNVVASSGTALTSEQIKSIKRYTPNIILSFDEDSAGELAADRGIREAMAQEMNIKVVELPEGKDPDECIRKNIEAWKKAVTEAKPMMQYYFDKTFTKLDTKKVDDRRQAAKILLPIIARIGNAIEQDFWLKKISEKIDVSEKLLRETLSKTIKSEKISEKKYNSKTSSGGNGAAKQVAASTREEKLSELLIALIIKFPELAEYSTRHLQGDQVIGENNKAIYRNLVFYYNNITRNDSGQISGQAEKKDFDFNGFKEWFANELDSINHIENTKVENQLNFLDKLALLGDKEFYDLEIEQAKNEIIKIAQILRRFCLNSRMREIEKLMSQLETDNKEEGRADKIKELMGEFKILSEELKEIET